MNETKTSWKLRLQNLIKSIYLLFKHSFSGYNRVLMPRFNFPMTRRRISTGIDTMISLTCSLVLCRHDCCGNQRNRHRNASEILSWRISRHLNFRSRLVFMQDGAPAHTSKMAMEWLKDRFPEKLISLKSEFIGPHIYQILTTYIFIFGVIWKMKSRKKNSCYNYSSEEASQRDHRINSCGNSAARHWKIELSNSNSIVARRRMFEK